MTLSSLVPESSLTALLARLSTEHPQLVFWKHLDRGLAGMGDIDALAPPDVAERVCESYAEGVRQIWKDVEIVFACRHALGVHPVFVVRGGQFPSLEQFDVSHAPVRMGVRWCDPSRVPTHTHLNACGIRVLRPGAQAVVLLILYGLHRIGRPRFKPYDRIDIQNGLGADRSGAHAFAEDVLPIQLRKAMHRWIEAGLPNPDSCGACVTWNAALAWWACMGGTVGQILSSPVWAIRYIWERNNDELCEVRRVVHHHNRKVPDGVMNEFVERMVSNERVLFQRNVSFISSVACK